MRVCMIGRGLRLSGAGRGMWGAASGACASLRRCLLASSSGGGMWQWQGAAQRGTNGGAEGSRTAARRVQQAIPGVQHVRLVAAGAVWLGRLTGGSFQAVQVVWCRAPWSCGSCGQQPE